MKQFRLLGVGLLIAMASPGTPGAAQVSAAANAGLFSAYVWRGVTYTNNFVIQPDLSVTLPVKKLSLTGGLWANVEPARYNHFRDISESGGEASFDVAEIDWTGELGVPVTKRTTLAVGATGYIFPNDAGLTESQNTVELYGRADITGALNPTVSLYYDIGAVKGAYLEGGISHVFAPDSHLPVTVGGLAGLCMGQDADVDAAGEPRAESFNFQKNGFTHADLWATADVSVGALALSPALHVIVTGDDATKATRMEHDPNTGLPGLNRTGAKLWLGVTVGWAR